MSYLYYPGCSLKGSSIDYDESFKAIVPALNIAVQEMQDWQCCGATVAKSIDEDLAESLPLSTLMTASKEGKDILMLCPSCHVNHVRVRQKALKESSSLKVHEVKQLSEVKQLLEVLICDVGIDALKKQVVKPLNTLRVLPYYGCLTVRPFRLAEGQGYEHPKAMENTIAATGAKPLFFPSKVDCCGGTLLFSKEGLALKLCSNILKEAKKSTPDCIVVTCPLCQFMLDAKQAAVEKLIKERIGIPVLYITQFLGLAFGLDKESLGLQRLITPPKQILQKIQ